MINYVNNITLKLSQKTYLQTKNNGKSVKQVRQKTENTV